MAEIEYKTKLFWHVGVNPLNRFDSRSIRTVKPSPGIRIRLGCPKGYWNSRSKRCKTSTKTVSFLLSTKKYPTERDVKDFMTRYLD